MNKYKFVKFQVKNFRSLLDITLNIDNNNINTICGENNIGKTNFLRALNLFLIIIMVWSIIKMKIDHIIFKRDQLVVEKQN